MATNITLQSPLHNRKGNRILTAKTRPKPQKQCAPTNQSTTETILASIYLSFQPKFPNPAFLQVNDNIFIFFAGFSARDLQISIKLNKIIQILQKNRYAEKTRQNMPIDGLACFCTSLAFSCILLIIILLIIQTYLLLLPRRNFPEIKPSSFFSCTKDF